MVTQSDKERRLVAIDPTSYQVLRDQRNLRTSENGDGSVILSGKLMEICRRSSLDWNSGEEEELEAYAGPRVESNNGKDLHCRVK